MLTPFRLRTVLLILLICLLAAALVGLAHVRVEVKQRTAALKIEHSILLQAVQGLRLELTSLMRPDTLRRLAHEQMGMHAPRPAQVIQP